MSIEYGHGSSDAPFIETDLHGYNLLNNPLLNKGTAFTEQERDTFDLHGLLPPNVATLDEQVSRSLQATNEVLFYALLVRNLEEMLPIVYTPVVGLGCQQFSRFFRRPRGLFLSIPHQLRIKRILA